MRFLADESCDFAVVRVLRSADHDVLAIAEVSPREEDQDVMERAVRETASDFIDPALSLLDVAGRSEYSS